MNFKKTFIQSILLLLSFIPNIVLADSSCDAPMIVCHERTILQLAEEIEQLKKKLDKNESYVKQEIEQLKKRLDKNESRIKKVENLADTALSTAKTAQENADTALDKVEVAQSTADLAINKAKVAQNTAKIALSKAQAANDTNDTTFLVGSLSSATLTVILLILIF
jgi:DNA repair exonuclease SbcCD ATPase subunit